MPLLPEYNFPGIEIDTVVSLSNNLIKMKLDIEDSNYFISQIENAIKYGHSLTLSRKTKDSSQTIEISFKK
jgi:hypothetical protein